MTSTSRTAHGEIEEDPWQGWGAFRLSGRHSTRHDRDMGNLDDDRCRGLRRPGAIRRPVVAPTYVADTGARSRPHEPRRSGQSIPRRVGGSGISLACGESRRVASEQRGRPLTVDCGLPRPRSPPSAVPESCLPAAKCNAQCGPAPRNPVGSSRAALLETGPDSGEEQGDETAFSLI